MAVQPLHEPIEHALNFLQMLVARAPIGIVMLDRRMRIIEASPRLIADFGSTRDQFVGKDHGECFPHLPERWEEAHRRGLAGESLSGGYDSLIAANGKEHWINWQITPWGDSGNETGGILIWSEDVTGRKRVKAAARRRDKEYRALFANMPEALAHCRIIDSADSPDFIFLSVNKAFVSLTGLRNVRGRKMSEVFAGRPKFGIELLDVFRRVAVTGVPEKLELYLDSLGQWLSTSTYSPEPDSFVVIFDVITARREAECAARQWQHAFEQSGIGIGLTSAATGTVEMMNAAAERILGYTSDELAGRHVSLLYSSREWARQVSELNRLNPESGHVQFEVCVRRKDGSEFPALLDSTLVRDDTGNVISRINVLQDLTALKRAEAHRRESERTVRALLDSAPQGILAVNPEGRIVFANRKTGTIFGYTDAELAGRHLQSLIPESAGDTHSVHLRNYFSRPRSRSMGQGMTLTGVRRDHSTFPAEISLSFIEGAPLEANDVEANDADQAPHHPTHRGLAVAFVTDVTECKRLEATAREHARQIQALSSSLLTSQEDERRRLSRELHDGLCQHLAFLSIQIGAMAGKFETGDIRKELKILQARAGAAAETARHLAHELHPSSLDDLGLVISLQSLCEEFSAENSIPVRFTSRNVPRSVSRETASCFYRITEQSLRNIIQHSGAAHVSVDLSSSAGVVILSVQDDGTGFDFEKVRGRGSLGLTGMQERARLANGTLGIASQPGRGTRIKVEIPFPEVPR